MFATPSRAATCSIAFCGSQPPACSCARHRIGMTADCWRPSGYFAIWSLAQSKFSAVKENSFGCSSGGARRRTAISVLPPHGMILPLPGGEREQISRAARCRPSSSVDLPEHDVERAEDRRDVGEHVAFAEEIHRLERGES